MMLAELNAFRGVAISDVRDTPILRRVSSRLLFRPFSSRNVLLLPIVFSSIHLIHCDLIVP
jgi:hypothetical protein